MAPQRWMVVYDTSSDSRRRKMATLLLRVGERLQLSVFELRVSPARMKLLIGSLSELAEEGDRILAVPLGEDALQRSWAYGHDFEEVDAPRLL